MKVRRVPKLEQQQKVSEVASLLQIEQLLDRKPGALSGGQRQRVAMGRALVREPVLFLFDEPLSNLDAKLRVELRGEIKRLHERLRASIVYVTHDQIEAMTLGTHIAVMNRGTIQQFGTPEDIFERPANLFVADFMGSPPMNLIPAVVSFKSGGAELTFGGGQRVVDPEPPATLKAYEGKSVMLGVRPEALRAGAALTGTITLVESSGSDTFVTLNFADRPIIARLSGRHRLDHQTEFGFDIDASSACYFDLDSGLRVG